MRVSFGKSALFHIPLIRVPIPINIIMQPKYDLEKIKCATDGPTFDKAVALYESGKVMQFEEAVGTYSAVVQGSKPYRVSVEARRYDHGHCECYLGQHNTLCKHMVVVPFGLPQGADR